MTQTILIVEDNELNLRLFRDVLRVHGYKTIETKNGRDTVPLACRHKPDLIVLDVQMPHVSGLDISKMLKADDALKHIPVIGVTSFTMEADKKRVLSSGCDAYMAKPISVAGFIKIVSRYLNGDRPSAKRQATVG